MPRNHHEPIVFQIGFNRCGTKYLTSIFSINGYIAKHWEGGALAEDIAFAKAADIEPLSSWPDAVFFSDMESVHKIQRPPVLAFKEFEYLHSWFPDAVFILNKRKVSDWISSRFSHHGGEYKRFWSHHLDVDPARLPDIWETEWNEHFAHAIRYFRGNDKFFIYDIDSNRPEDLTEFLGSWFTLDKKPKVPENIRPNAREKQKRNLANRRLETNSRSFSSDNKFINSVAAHCIGDLKFQSSNSPPHFASYIYGKWDGKKSVLDKDGAELPIKMGVDGAFHSKPNIFKLDRTESVINEMISLNLHGSVQIDMQDSRRYGTRQGPKVEWPLLVYNRREDTTNMVLWPLPGYHTLGQPHFVHSEPIDKINFADKIDRAVWRGNLSGRPNEKLAPSMTERRGANHILEHLASTQNEEEQVAIHEELLGITRYNLVARFFMSKDVDAALTLNSKFSQLKKSPLLKLYWDKRVDQQWFFESKYILSLSGFDTGSNFLMAANSNSVVMKEEDGWELFYTKEFQPWEHYIPLELGALDVEEKLDWARANPERCMDMIKSSQQVCAKLANPVNRAKILRRVFSAIKQGQ